MSKKNPFPKTIYVGVTDPADGESVLVADPNTAMFDDGEAVAVYELKEIRNKTVVHSLGEVIK